MSVDNVLDYGYKFTCTFCATVRTTLIGAFIAFMAFGENVGRARAHQNFQEWVTMKKQKTLC